MIGVTAACYLPAGCKDAQIQMRLTQAARYLRAVEFFEVRAELLANTEVDSHKTDNGRLPDATLRILKTLQCQTRNYEHNRLNGK